MFPRPGRCKECCHEHCGERGDQGVEFSGGTVVKNSFANARDMCSIPRSGRSPGVENGYLLQCSCRGNPMDRENWWATVHEFVRVRHDRLKLTFPFIGFPGGSDGKESACHAGSLDSIPGLGRSPGEQSGNPLQCSCRGNPMDRGAWQATPMGLQKSQQLNNNSNLCT